RDRNVTGVQTCALPISGGHPPGAAAHPGLARHDPDPMVSRAVPDPWARGPPGAGGLVRPAVAVPGRRLLRHIDANVLLRPLSDRSEERRVGTECRASAG